MGMKVENVQWYNKIYRITFLCNKDSDQSDQNLRYPHLEASCFQPPMESPAMTYPTARMRSSVSAGWAVIL